MTGVEYLYGSLLPCNRRLAGRACICAYTWCLGPPLEEKNDMEDLELKES